MNRVHLIAGAFALLVLALFVTPAPSAFTANADEVPQSVRLDFTASRSLTGKYGLDLEEVSAKPMTVLVWDAIVHNALGDKFSILRTSDHVADIALKNTAQQTVARTEKKVGDFSIFRSSSREFTVVFQDVPPGTYHVAVALVDERGETRATLDEEFTIYAR